MPALHTALVSRSRGEVAVLVSWWLAAEASSSAARAELAAGSTLVVLEELEVELTLEELEAVFAEEVQEAALVAGSGW